MQKAKGASGKIHLCTRAMLNREIKSCQGVSGGKAEFVADQVIEMIMPRLSEKFW